jgi:hypothetical protein
MTHWIHGPGGALLTPGALVWVEGRDAHAPGVLTAIDAAGLRLQREHDYEELIAWSTIDRVSVRVPRPRQWLGIALWAVAGAAFLGSCGAEFAKLGEGGEPSHAAATGTALGACGGALFGSLLAFTAARHRWTLVFESRGDDEAREPRTVEQRLAEGNDTAVATRTTTARARVRESATSWLLFVAILIALVVILKMTVFR